MPPFLFSLTRSLFLYVASVYSLSCPIRAIIRISRSACSLNFLLSQTIIEYGLFRSISLFTSLV